MTKETEEVVNCMKNNTVEFYMDRRSSDMLDPNSKTKYFDIHICREFMCEGNRYYMITCFRYLDYHNEEKHYHGYWAEFRLQDDSSGCRSYTGPGPLIQGPCDHFHNFDVTHSDFRALLKADLTASYFPENIIQMIMEQDLSTGFTRKEVKPLFSCDRIEYISEPQMALDSWVPVIMKIPYNDNGDGCAPCAVSSTSYSRMSIQQRINEQADEYVGSFYRDMTSTIIRLANWIKENTTGRVMIYGHNRSWDILFFENKMDAMMFKLAWRDEDGL